MKDTVGTVTPRGVGRRTRSRKKKIQSDDKSRKKGGGCPRTPLNEEIGSNRGVKRTATSLRRSQERTEKMIRLFQEDQEDRLEREGGRDEEMAARQQARRLLALEDERVKEDQIKIAISNNVDSRSEYYIDDTCSYDSDGSRVLEPDTAEALWKKTKRQKMIDEGRFKEEAVTVPIDTSGAELVYGPAGDDASELSVHTKAEDYQNQPLQPKTIARGRRRPR